MEGSEKSGIPPEEVLLARRIKPDEKVRTVAIVGGTHGNERIGVHLIEHFAASGEDPLAGAPVRGCAAVQRGSFETKLLVGNPAAVVRKGTGAGTRYVDEDLNRCFLASSLYGLAQEEAASTIEAGRARTVDAALGPKCSPNPAADFILDLHNTTSNTGTLLCFHPDDEFALRVAAHLHHHDPAIRMCLWPGGDRALLPTVGRGGMTVEVGPLAHSTVDAKLLQHTMQLIHRVLDFIDDHNTRLDCGSSPSPLPDRRTLPLFQGVGKLDYPRDAAGRPTGFVHPSLQVSVSLSVSVSVTDPLPLSPLSLSLSLSFSHALCSTTCVCFEPLVSHSHTCTHSLSHSLLRKSKRCWCCKPHTHSQTFYAGYQRTPRGLNLAVLVPVVWWCVCVRACARARARACVGGGLVCRGLRLFLSLVDVCMCSRVRRLPHTHTYARVRIRQHTHRCLSLSFPHSSPPLLRSSVPPCVSRTKTRTAQMRRSS